MELVLHIGTEKTGTESFQVWCYSNMDALRSQHIWYARSLALDYPGGCRKLAICCRDADLPDEAFFPAGVISREAHESFWKTTQEEFFEEVGNAKVAGAKYFVISSEHLHSRLSSPRMVARVKEFIEGAFSSVRVMVHLRPQVDVAVSYASTASRNGHRVDREFFPKQVRENFGYYDYQALIKRWEDVFGAKSIEILPFKRNSSMVDRLLALTEANTAALSPVPRLNSALGILTMALLNNIKHSPAGDLIDLSDIVGFIPVDDKLQIGLSTARQFQNHFRSSNAELVRRRGEIAFEDLEPEWNRYSEPENVEVLEYVAPFAEQLAFVVGCLNGRLLSERAAARLAECDAAIARGYLQVAEQLLVEASYLTDRAEKAPGAAQVILAEMREKARSMCKAIRERSGNVQTAKSENGEGAI